MAERNADNDIQAVSRTAQILALFGPHREHVTAVTVAELTGLNRTTAHRYLTSMESAGLLERSEDGYTVGRVVVQLASFHMGRQQLLRVAPGVMRRFTDEVRLSSALSLWGAHGPVVVHVAEDTTRELLLTVPLGSQMDLFSGHAQVWLAFADDQLDAQRIMSMLPTTTRDELEELVAATRETGLGLRAIPDAGYVALAAPIRAGGTMVGAMSVLGTPALLPPRRDSLIATALRACAATISQRLGDAG